MPSSDRRWRRVRVERGIYVQPNGLYSVCVTIDGKPRFRVVDARAIDEPADSGTSSVAPLVESSCPPART
jgi:hypothetical protein